MYELPGMADVHAHYQIAIFHLNTVAACNSDLLKWFHTLYCLYIEGIPHSQDVQPVIVESPSFRKIDFRRENLGGGKHQKTGQPVIQWLCSKITLAMVMAQHFLDKLWGIVLFEQLLFKSLHLEVVVFLGSVCSGISNALSHYESFEDWLGKKYIRCIGTCSWVFGRSQGQDVLMLGIFL